MAKHGSQWTKNMSPTKAPCQYTCHGGPRCRLARALVCCSSTERPHPSPLPPPFRPGATTLSRPLLTKSLKGALPFTDLVKRCLPIFWRALPHPLAGMAPKGSYFAPRRGRPTLGLYGRDGEEVVRPCPKGSTSDRRSQGGQDPPGLSAATLRWSL